MLPDLWAVGLFFMVAAEPHSESHTCGPRRQAPPCQHGLPGIGAGPPAEGAGNAKRDLCPEPGEVPSPSHLGTGRRFPSAVGRTDQLRRCGAGWRAEAARYPGEATAVPMEEQFVLWRKMMGRSAAHSTALMARPGTGAAQLPDLSDAFCPDLNNLNKNVHRR